MPGRSWIATLGPFVAVAALAAWFAAAALLSTPAARGVLPEITAAPSAPVSPNVVLTPSPTTPAVKTPAPASSASEMLRVHNELRAAIGASALRADDRVTVAAQRHAEYLARHRIVGHEETPGQEGFTGASVRDRLAAQGYPDANASEVATIFTSAIEGLRSLWVLPYHRLGLMHPHAVVAGWGHAEIAGRTATVGVLVYDFAAPVPERVRSPAPGQRVAGTWAGEEFPDVLPSGADRPVGYPVMIVYANAPAVQLRNARLTDGRGAEVAHYVVPQLYERDYVAIVPARPLAAGERYRVRLDLTVAGSEVVEEWDFEAER